VVIFQKTLADVVDALIAQSPDTPDAATRSQMRQQALDSLVDFELLYQESQKQHLSVSDAAIADSIKTTEARFGSPKEYSAALSAKKLTRKDVERDTRKMLAVNRVLEEVVWKDIYIDNQAIRTFYEENREQFQHPDEMRVSEILIRVPRGATPAARGEARAKAERCLQRARAGEDFAAVHLEFQTDDGLTVLGEATTSWSFVGAGLRLSAELLGPEYSMQWNSLDAGLKLFFSREVHGAEGEDLVEKQNAEMGLMPVVASEAVAYGYEAENRHFVRAFLGKEAPLLTFEDGVDVVRVLMTTYQSAEEGRTLDFPPKGITEFVPDVARGGARLPTARI